MTGFTLTRAEIEAQMCQAIFLRAHLRLLDKGMRHSQLPASTILAKAGKITNKDYGRASAARISTALSDINKWIEDNK